MIDENGGPPDFPEKPTSNHNAPAADGSLDRLVRHCVANHTPEELALGWLRSLTRLTTQSTQKARTGEGSPDALFDYFMANITEENFVIKLTDAAKSHEEWLSIVRFGLATLLENQLLLMECIVREACRERERSTLKTRVAADEARKIMEELGLRFYLSNKEVSDR